MTTFDILPLGLLTLVTLVAFSIAPEVAAWFWNKAKYHIWHFIFEEVPNPSAIPVPPAAPKLRVGYRVDGGSTATTEVVAEMRREIKRLERLCDRLETPVPTEEPVVEQCAVRH